MSVLGNIALWTMRENPDLVENVSTTDERCTRMSERADRAIVVRHAERNHHDMVMSMQRSTRREIENLYMVDAYD